VLARWGWFSVNPLHAAESPGGVVNNPEPPTADQAAAIVAEAFGMDLGWGVLVWLAIVTGARRGELCALRWECVDLDCTVVAI
jgi:integrase